MTTHDKPTVSITYDINKIFECQNDNCVIIKDLEKYCEHTFKTPNIILTELMKQMDDITKSHSNGINPNDIILKSMVRDSLNKIVHSNYRSILEDLKSLNYTSENHFSLLANEIILKSMGDAMACKGIDVPKNGQRTPSEIYVDTAYEFASYMIDVDGNPIKFKNVMAKECQNYFNKFIDKKERMDHNNLTRISNFKGFMNMIGLLYAVGLFPCHIIDKCFEKITNLVVDTSLPQEECDNYYSGFERLMNRILYHFENENHNITNETVQRNKVNDFIEARKMIQKYNELVLTVCPDDGKNSNPKTLRKFSGMVHNQNMLRFNALCEKYDRTS